MRIKLFTICATCLKYGSLALQRTKIKHCVGRKEEMCRLPSAGLQVQSDLSQKKNASNFQTNLILNLGFKEKSLFLILLIENHLGQLGKSQVTRNCKDKPQVFDNLRR